MFLSISNKKNPNLYDADGTVANINKKNATNRLNVYIVV